MSGKKPLTVSERYGDEELRYEADDIPRSRARIQSVTFNYAIPASAIQEMLAEQDDEA